MLKEKPFSNCYFEGSDEASKDKAYIEKPKKE